MARIAGVDLPNNKRGEIGLTYIYGIGRSSAQAILTKAGIDYDTKVKDWNDGYWLLQRYPSSSRITRSRTDYQKQCPYPQGPQENGS